MEFESQYIAHTPDANGFVAYDKQEQLVWNTLYNRQVNVQRGRACQAYLDGLDALKLTPDAIPQLPDVSSRLRSMTGWQVEPVQALISARAFFELLSQRKFPAATFIRRKDALDYVTEPDIFHEIFGHCPMLTHQVFADFMQAYAKRVLELPESDWPLLQRFFWFTVEFGLIQESSGLRAYGGGILSSIGETAYSVESHQAMRVMFDPLVIMRMPYRIDKLQPVYFIIQNYETLFEFINSDWPGLISKARQLGEYPPYFSVEGECASIHIGAC